MKIRGLVRVSSFVYPHEEHDAVRDALRERLDNEGVPVDYLWLFTDWNKYAYQKRGWKLPLTQDQMKVHADSTAEDVDAQGDPLFNAFFIIAPLNETKFGAITAAIANMMYIKGKPVLALMHVDADPVPIIGMTPGNVPGCYRFVFKT